MKAGGRTGRVLVRLAALTAVAAAVTALAQALLVERLAPLLAEVLAQVPPPAAEPATSASGTPSAAAAGSGSPGTDAGADTGAGAGMASAAGGSRATLPRVESLRALARPTAPAGAASASSGATQRGTPHVTRAEIDDAIQAKLDGASAKLVRDAEGAPVGLSILQPGRLARLGVTTGDVLYAANGVRIRTPDEGLSALAQLEKATRVVVTFRRGEGSFSIVVDIAP